ncbi:hypothetical protein SLH46_15215 [Draconibacterium sp. IB214405]|uniref:hypothetical protein n=1 Tax=Draconibacterium sp. IB214405 TaxID=3097352 RepID=UPI002A1722A2|nr:hypothetical protein [Draconibacterium sp. IB214405]MDX8340548.1 hypothetical protein [Draconibacterium sp. IB214405]
METWSDIIKKKYGESEKIKSLDKSKLLALKYHAVENFDLFYHLNFSVSKIKPGHKNFLAVQLLQYSVFFDNNEDKITFCQKIIDKLELDIEGTFKNYPDDREGLLTFFRMEWDGHRKKNNKTDESEALLKRLSSIEERVSLIPQLQHCIVEMMNAKSKKTQKRSPSKVKYEDLFKYKETPEALKEIFRKHGYIDKNDCWQGQTGAKNELAIAYFVLKEPEYGFQLIKQGGKKPQLIALYREFGLQVSEQLVSNTYVTIRNLTTRPSESDSHDEFKRTFRSLLNHRK